mmetsp:Transcript_67454/g.186065  ORF Transcript_67454/g.186065 Transcript_67454/m.186065 type:complete len:208 (-) Transcript_67454:4694-5317(-)
MSPTLRSLAARHLIGGPQSASRCTISKPPRNVRCLTLSRARTLTTTCARGRLAFPAARARGKTMRALPCRFTPNARLDYPPLRCRSASRSQGLPSAATKVATASAACRSRRMVVLPARPTMWSCTAQISPTIRGASWWHMRTSTCQTATSSGMCRTYGEVGRSTAAIPSLPPSAPHSSTTRTSSNIGSRVKLRKSIDRRWSAAPSSS